MNTIPTYEPGMSIIICCYNSALRLPETLRALAQQQIPAHSKFPVEVLVLDNVSKDDTTAVASAIVSAPDFPHSGKVLYAAEPGKSRALELGLTQAKYRYVVIVDDDNSLNPDYLALAWAIMEGNSQIGALGGVGIPVSAQPWPEWFPRFAIDYAAAPQATHSGDITQTNQFVYGAGMVLRQSAWQDVKSQGFKSLVTEVRGNKPSGEDNEMCYALVLGGYKIWYDARLRFQHFIPSERLSWKYLVKTYRINAVAHVEIRPWVFFLQAADPHTAKIPAFVWLRDSVYLLRYMATHLLGAIRRGELGQEGSASSLKAYYFWHSFLESLRQAWRGGQGFQQLQAYIGRLRARPRPIAT